MSAMRCLVGDFTWDLGLDGLCPNHGSRDRIGRPRDSGAFCGERGPEDATGTPYLDCCSAPMTTERTP